MTAENMESEQVPEKASDMEIADFLIGHIDGPCEVEVSPGKWENIRHFYIDEAEKQLPTFTDEVAKQKLIDKIAEYKK